MARKTEGMEMMKIIMEMRKNVKGRKMIQMNSDQELLKGKRNRLTNKREDHREKRKNCQKRKP